MAGPTKKRLDILLVEKGLAQSRERAKTLIMAGKVLVNDLPFDKAGSLVDIHSNIILKGSDLLYVSRGGLKLKAAIDVLALDVTDLVCLDIGASTGGFTDCLLQQGAKKVYAVDVGYGQLAWELRQNPRVIVIERTNIRYMPFETINEKVDLIVADTSFISLKKVIPAAEKFMKDQTRVLALIKPQFEAGKIHVGKNGVVRDSNVRHQVILDLELFFQKRGYLTQDIIPSPVSGPKGNQEYIIPLTFLENHE